MKDVTRCDSPIETYKAMIDINAFLNPTATLGSTMFNIDEARRLTFLELPITTVTNNKSNKTSIRKSTVRQIIRDSVPDIFSPFTKEMKIKVLETAKNSGFTNTTLASLESTIAVMRKEAKKNQQTPQDRYKLITQARGVSHEQSLRRIDNAIGTLNELRKILVAAADSKERLVDRITLLEKKLEEIRKTARG